MKNTYFIKIALLFTLFIATYNSVAQEDSIQTTFTPAAAVTTNNNVSWYDRINLRGYMQIRYNRLFETNDQLKCEQCDRSWGENGGIFMRRMRLVFFGNIHERVFFYVQPDFASSAGGSTHYGQIRDAYFDLGLNKDNSLRLRLGQSKIIFGYENMQSSQNRLPLDRNDALNSAFANERDLAAFVMWAPKELRQRLAKLVRSGMKGSGDYGVVSFGVFNGQTANRPDLNNELHMAARVSYPFMLKSGQIIEPGLQAYTGNVVIAKSNGVGGANEFLDQRVAASFILSPQPFGIQAEYNIGTGPQYNPETNTIEQKELKGGYITLSYFINKNDHIYIPFVRAQRYEGGKKHELDARSYDVTEFEIGVEWQPIKQFELVAMYTISDRRFEDSRLRDNRQTGSLLRLQAQVNF